MSQEEPIKPMLCGVGRFFDPHPADERIEKLVNELIEELKTATENKYSKFKPVSYRTKIDYGTTHLVKIETDKQNEFIHAKIHVPYTEKLELQGVQQNKTNEDALAVF